MNKLEKIMVLMYQGNVYTRDVYTYDSTIYMDSEIASFPTREEADAYINEMFGENAYDHTWEN